MRRPSFYSRVDEIPPTLKEQIVACIRKDYTDDDASNLDVAVDIAYGWNPQLVCAENDWELPQYLMDIVESVRGKE